MPPREWRLARNCSLAPIPTVLAYALPCLLALAIAVVFALDGAWPVLMFALLEAAGVAAAFLQYARHANDFERIALAGHSLVVESAEAGHWQRTQFDPGATRVLLPSRPGEPAYLVSYGRRVAIGRFVADPVRWQVACELKAQLGRG